MSLVDEICRLMLRRRDRFAVRIQVKLQRKEKQAPKIVSLALRKRLVDPPDLLYVVEVQRTRTGKRALKNAIGETLDEVLVEETRPYRHGEFDILAVNMHPSTKDWKRLCIPSLVGFCRVPTLAWCNSCSQLPLFETLTGQMIFPNA